MSQAAIITTAQQNLIIYEMPLTDTARICLRLEHLFQQFDHTIQCASLLDTKNAMGALLKVLEVTERPDIKSKLSQTITQFSNTLTQLARSPQVDVPRLQKTLKELEMLNQYLHTHHLRIGEPLRQNDFLSQIRSNLTTPGGVSNYRLPAFMLWQNKSPTEKSKDLQEWMHVFQPMRNITKTLLTLTRESAPLETVVAENGFYLQPLNPAVPCQLVRIAISTQFNLYPEFGAGKHRLTIRFLTPHYFGGGRPTQTQHPVSFQLACCKI